jgi:hypothetical protein
MFKWLLVLSQKTFSADRQTLKNAVDLKAVATSPPFRPLLATGAVRLREAERPLIFANNRRRGSGGGFILVLGRFSVRCGRQHFNFPAGFYCAEHAVTPH